MQEIPENRQDEKKILREQLALLAERSKVCEDQELSNISIAMLKIAESLRS